MGAKVVGVHGVFQYRFHEDPNELANIWRAHIDALASPDDFSLAYYSSALHTNSAQGAERFADLDEFETDLVAAWLRSAGAPRAIAQGPATQWIRDGLDWLVRSGATSRIAPAIVPSVFREVGTYLRDQDRRSEARQLVADAIRKEQPRVVVGHSLGSVVAYESLWENPDLQVETLLTLGSPLALSAVFYEHLQPDGAMTHSRPPGTKRWVNIADTGDLIALPRHLAGFYSGIACDLETQIDLFEFHRIVPYLGSNVVREAIHKALASAES